MKTHQISKKAIIVEDNLILSVLYENYLKEMVFETVGEVTSGEEAVEMVRKYSPDIVVMDIMLEGEMDGVDAAEQIREFTSAPIIFVTGNSDQVHMDKAKKIDNSKFLKKPVSEEILKKAVNYLTSKEQSNN